MSLFESMLELASKIKVQTSETKFPLLTSHLNDLNKHDRDIVLNDMQKGDVWLWVLKSNGCGTYLLLLDGNVDRGFASRIKEEGAMLFLINVTGLDEGSIKPVDARMAEGMLDEAQFRGERVPRRLSLYNQITDLLDLKAKGVTLSSTKFCSDFSIAEGDISFIRLTKQSSNVELYVDRLVFTLSKRNLKTSLYYQFSTTQALNELLFVGDKYYKITATDDIHCVVTEITESKYKGRKVSMAA